MCLIMTLCRMKFMITAILTKKQYTLSSLVASVTQSSDIHFNDMRCNSIHSDGIWRTHIDQLFLSEYVCVIMQLEKMSFIFYSVKIGIYPKKNWKQQNTWYKFYILLWLWKWEACVWLNSLCLLSAGNLFTLCNSNFSVIRKDEEKSSRYKKKMAVQLAANRFVCLNKFSWLLEK